MILTFLLLVFTIGCGQFKMEVEQKEPLVVEHRVNLKDIEKYFSVKCEEELTVVDSPDTDLDESYTPTETEVEHCVDLKMADFVEIVK